MRAMKLLLAVAAVALPIVAAEHESGCVFTSVDPTAVNTFDTPVFGRIYVEERDNPLGTQPPVPGSGFLMGGGTWVRQESNGLPGMQRGWCEGQELPEPTGGPLAKSASASCTVGNCWPSWDICLIIGEDPIHDETCGHRGDRWIF